MESWNVEDSRFERDSLHMGQREVVTWVTKD